MSAPDCSVVLSRRNGGVTGAFFCELGRRLTQTHLVACLPFVHQIGSAPLDAAAARLAPHAGHAGSKSGPGGRQRAGAGVPLCCHRGWMGRASRSETSPVTCRSTHDRFSLSVACLAFGAPSGILTGCSRRFIPPGTCQLYASICRQCTRTPATRPACGRESSEGALTSAARHLGVAAKSLPGCTKQQRMGITHEKAGAEDVLLPVCRCAGLMHT